MITLPDLAYGRPIREPCYGDCIQWPGSLIPLGQNFWTRRMLDFRGTVAATSSLRQLLTAYCL
jgi:hypothetical protein